MPDKSSELVFQSKSCQLISLELYGSRASQVALVVKNPLASEGDMKDLVSIPGLGRSLCGGGQETHTSIPAWGIPWIDESSRLRSIGLQSRTWLKQFRTQAHTDLILVGKFYPTEKGKNYYGWSLQKLYFSKGKTMFVFIFIYLFGCAGYCCSTQTLTCDIWDLIPRAGIKPRSLALGVRSCSHWITREVPTMFLIIKAE